MRSLLMGIAALVWVGGAAAAIYKWVDANGVTHYSETPPEARDSQQMSIHGGTTAPAAKPAAPEAAKPAPSAGQQATAGHEPTAAERKSFCELARRNVQTLESGAPVFQKLADGQGPPLNQAQRDAALADDKKRVARYCD